MLVQDSFFSAKGLIVHSGSADTERATRIHIRFPQRADRSTL